MPQVRLGHREEAANTAAELERRTEVSRDRRPKGGTGISSGNWRSLAAIPLAL